MIQVFYTLVQPVELPLVKYWAEMLPSALQAYGASHLEDQKALPRFLAHTLLRWALHHTCGLEGPLAFSYGPHQKPYLQDHPRVYFNLSHTGTAALCAVGDQEMGADVQALRPVSDRLARKVMTQKEYEQYRSSNSPEHFFTQLWTLKESYMKLTGAGLSLPLQSMEFTIAHEGASLRGSDCQFTQYSGIPGCYAAACCWGEAPNPFLQEVPLETLRQQSGPAG